LFDFGTAGQSRDEKWDDLRGTWSARKRADRTAASRWLRIRAPTDAAI